MAEIPNITRSDGPIRNRGSAPCEAAASAVDDEPLGVDEAPEDSLGDGNAPAGPGPVRWIWQGKMPDAFWKAATLFSFAINLGLVIALIALGLMVFQIKQGSAQPLMTGLHTSFVQMDAAHIVTSVQVVDTIHVIDTIQVNDTRPVVFDLPLSTHTTVTLTRDIPIPNTTVCLNGLPVPTNFVLPAGTPLDINLDRVVPVSKTVPVMLDVPVSLNVPVNLNVPIDIPLNQTELHAPFTGLANLAGPYDSLLSAAPSSWSDLFHL
jgi:hypothetical protein